MKIKIASFLISLLCVLAMVHLSSAEQVQRDIFASVIVNGVFNMAVDNSNLNFGYAEPGKSIELNPATHYNTAKCSSNKGKQWYVKISIVGDITGPTPSIPLESFKWMVYRVTGDGTAISEWKPFMKGSQVVYTSGPLDIQGQDVAIMFKYKLDLPANAAAGYYRTKVLYTMTDNPLD